MPSSAPQIPAERPWPEIELTRLRSGSRLKIAPPKQAPGFERETYVPVSALAAFKERLLSDEAIEETAKAISIRKYSSERWGISLSERSKTICRREAKKYLEAALASIDSDGGKS